MHPYAHPENCFNIRLSWTVLKNSILNLYCNRKAQNPKKTPHNKPNKPPVFTWLNVQIKVTPNVT